MTAKERGIFYIIICQAIETAFFLNETMYLVRLFPSKLLIAWLLEHTSSASANTDSKSNKEGYYISEHTFPTVLFGYEALHIEYV